MTVQEQVTRRNMARTRSIVLMAFATNTGLNMILLGVLARLGGLELVGQWAFLNAILLTCLLADFGLTNALSYRIGRDGFDAVAPKLRTLLALLLKAAGLTLAGAVLGGQIVGMLAVAIALTVAASLAQLASNWLISIRMGRHEQYWFNVKTVIRAIAQTGLALILYLASPERTLLAFGTALLVAGTLEMGFALWMTRADNPLLGLRAPFADALAMAEGFGLLSLAQKSYEPLSRLMLSALLGPMALGVFTIICRIPIVVNQTVSEALRALLPGLSRMTGQDDRASVTRLLRDAVAAQVIMVGAPIIVICLHADLLFRVWLGQSTAELVLGLQILSLGILANTVTIPFFWAAQAFGEAPLLARANLVQLIVSLSLGAGSLWLTEDVVFFAGVFALSIAAAGVVALVVAQQRHGLVAPVGRTLQVPVLVLFLAATIGLNVAALWLGLASQLGDVWALLILAVANLVLLGPAGLFLMKRLKRMPLLTAAVHANKPY